MDPNTRITVEEALQHPWIFVCILNLAYVAGAKRGGEGVKSAKGCPLPSLSSPPPFFPFSQSPTSFNASLNFAVLPTTSYYPQRHKAHLRTTPPPPPPPPHKSTQMILDQRAQLQDHGVKMLFQS